jgi:riboflavin biosynthesis pyrimidine reductase
MPNQLSAEDLTELYAYPGGDRPWVRANFVSSLDGAAQGPDQKSGSLSGAADQLVFALLRTLSDAVIAGANTTRVEGYQPVRPHEVDGRLRSALGLAPVPAIAVVSRSLDLDPELLRGGDSPTLVVTTASAPASVRERLERSLPVIVAGSESVDLAVAVEELAGLGYTRLLCEGGPSLMRALVAADALDELCLTIAPLLVAGGGLRITQGDSIRPPRGMQLRHLLESDSVLFARYTKGSE